MPIRYFSTPHHSHAAGAPDQTDAIAEIDGMATSLVTGHGAQTYTPPAGYILCGEGKEITGYDDGGGPGTYYYQPALQKITTNWGPGGVNTDVHLHPKVLRLNLSPLTLHSVIDLAPTAPQVVDSQGQTNYRNATSVDSYDYSANNLKAGRGSSTDGLRKAGDQPFGYVADAQGDFHGCLFLGPWIVPKGSLWNQVYAVNSTTGARVEMLGFDTIAPEAAAWSFATDPLNPEWGQGFADYPFTIKLFNVVGALDANTLHVEVEEKDFTIETFSAFGAKGLNHSIDTTPTPDPGLVPAYSYPFPAESDGTWQDNFVSDSGSAGAPGIDTSAVDSGFDDTEHTHPVFSGNFYGSIFTPKGGATVGNLGLSLHPFRCTPPLDTGGPYPGPTLDNAAQGTALMGQLHSAFVTAANVSKFRSWRQKASRCYYVFLDVATLAEGSRFTPTQSLVSQPGEEGIKRGASTHTVEFNVPVAEVEFDVANYPGFYKPLPRTAPANHIGGGEGDLVLNGYGQFVHKVQELGPAADIPGLPNPRYAVLSMDNGVPVEWNPGDPGGIRLGFATGTAVPIANDTLFGTAGGHLDVYLTTVTAPAPEGPPKGMRPHPFHSTKSVNDGTRVIYLPRDSTAFGHVNAALGGDPEAETEDLHKVVCTEKSGAVWNQVWEFDTYQHMGGYDPGGGVVAQASGDCRSNAWLTASFLWMILWGNRGHYLVRLNKETGAFAGEMKLSDPLDLILTSDYFENFFATNRAPSGISSSGIWRLQVS